ncbi:MAG: DMT family transporter [Treponema sp.]|nr:DMT family transporter [Treponema sp.]
MKLKDNYHIYAVITIFFWSCGFVFTRLALRYFTPFSLGFLRYFFASLFFIVLAMFIKIKMPDKKDIKWFVLAGFFGFFSYIILFNIGSTTVSASTSSLIIATAPVITTLLARIVNKEKLKTAQYVAIIIEFTGVGVITLMNGIFSINTGLIWLMMASLALSLYNLFQKKLTKKYSALQASVYGIWFGTVLLLIFMPGSAAEAVNAPLIQIIHVIILGVFSSAIGFLSWTTAFSKSKDISSVSNYMFLTPFITTVLGVILAKETPDLATITGGIIILVGMFIYNFFDRIVLLIKK